MSRIDPHDPLAGPDPLAPARVGDGSGETPPEPDDTPTSVRHPAGASGLNPKEWLVRKPVYPHLAAHQCEAREWGYHPLAGTLDVWCERLNRRFQLALPRVPLRLDPRIRHTFAVYFRAGHNGFGLAYEVAVRVPPATGLAALDLGDVIGTLLHELLHLKQELTGVPGKDNYHNVAFRRLAAGVGLVVDARGRQAYDPAGAFLDILRTHGIARRPTSPGWAPQPASPQIRGLPVATHGMSAPTPPAASELVRRWVRQHGREHTWLFTFWTVGLEGSCRAAARQLALHDCSVVRKRLRNLQDRLGLTLIVPDGNGTRLTADGVALLKLLAPEFEARPD